MKKYILLSLIYLTSVSSFAQTFVEVSNQVVSLKSRDRLYGGELNSSSNLNPKISARFTLYRSKMYSWYIDGSYSNLVFNKDNFNNNSQALNQMALGFRLRPESHISLEVFGGYKETPIVYSSNGEYFIDKIGLSTIGMKGSLALKKVDKVTIIGEGSGTYFVKKNGYSGNEIGVGISVGTVVNDQYWKIGYRLEYESNYNNDVSNGLFKNSLYLKLHF